MNDSPRSAHRTASLERLDAELQRLRKAAHRRMAPLTARAELCWDEHLACDEASDTPADGHDHPDALGEDNEGTRTLDACAVPGTSAVDPFPAGEYKKT